MFPSFFIPVCLIAWALLCEFIHGAMLCVDQLFLRVNFIIQNLGMAKKWDLDKQ